MRPKRQDPPPPPTVTGSPSRSCERPQHRVLGLQSLQNWGFCFVKGGSHVVYTLGSKPWAPLIEYLSCTPLYPQGWKHKDGGGACLPQKSMEDTASNDRGQRLGGGARTGRAHGCAPAVVGDQPSRCPPHRLLGLSDERPVSPLDHAAMQGRPTLAAETAATLWARRNASCGTEACGTP